VVDGLLVVAPGPVRVLPDATAIHFNLRSFYRGIAGKTVVLAQRTDEVHTSCVPSATESSRIRILFSIGHIISDAVVP
jgi:hypothetical protein